MKTLSIKRMASVCVMMLVGIMAMAATPKKIYNDQMTDDGNVAIREICVMTSEGYKPSLRIEMKYGKDNNMVTKDLYTWNLSDNNWKLTKSYFYMGDSVRLVTYNTKGNIAADRVFYTTVDSHNHK